MIAFVDTSSLLKLYHTEEGSDRIIEILSGKIRKVFLSETAVLEFRSALWRKVRKGDLADFAAIKAIECFENNMNNFHLIRLNSALVESAKSLLMRYGNRGLRTLDSLQLASALTLKHEKCIFLSSDYLLIEFLKDENLDIEQI